MKVAIIGAGNVGKALAGSISRAGHEVTISASTPESARQAADAVGVAAAESNVDAASRAGVVILAVPFVGAGSEVAREIRDAVAGKTVVDATNPLKADASGLATTGTSAAEEFQKLLPDARVIKAFNTIFAANQASPSPEIDAYVAGDDGDAKQEVIGLAESLGFTPLDVGSLQTARALEAMAYLNIGLNAANGWSWTSAWKLER
ncbi:MAG TPA: NADPH-dependent F420 reductase [Candidatus Limnocylindria bacterium]|jgi:NADPH-dependent F420 reductase|nr:NADPH-dependent F420 reductase [Candidatus Limnocylindria bacterium]